MTTTPIRASYAIRPRRRIRRRHIAIALLAPPALAASAGLTAAIIQGTAQGMHAAASPAAAAPGGPTPGTIAFDSPTVDTSTTILAAAAATGRWNPAAFDAIHTAMRKCKEEDGSGGPLPCASGPQEGVKYIVFALGRRNRKTHIKPVIALYRDGHAERYTI